MNGELKFKRVSKLPCVIQLGGELELESDHLDHSKIRARVLIMSACNSLKPHCFIVKSNNQRDRLPAY